MQLRTFRGGLLALCAAVAAGGCGSSRPAWRVPDVADAPAPLDSWKRPPPCDAALAAFGEARRLQGLGRTSEAVAAVRRAVEDEPGFLEGHRLLQDLLARSTADWWLRERYERRLRENPSDADSNYLLARLESDPARQLELFSRAVSLDPTHPYATLGRAIAFARTGDVAAALTETRRATELAPRLALPWIWLGAESLRRGEAAAAARFFGYARDRAADDPRAWLGLAEAEDDLGRRDAASRAALAALALAPGDDATACAAVESLSRGAVPETLQKALETVAAAGEAGASRALCALFRGRLLLALGRPVDAAAAFEESVRCGVGAEEVAQPLRLARVLAGRFRDAVLGARETTPAEAFADDDLYAPRWQRLRAAASADLHDARALLALAEAMASVGWLEESRVVLVAARAADPLDAVIAARMASEAAFAAFVEDLGRVAREARDAGRRRGDEMPTVADLLARVREASLRRLGRDATAGALVRSYPLLGEFAVSVASGGAFETTFGSHGLLCLVGARSGGAADLVLGRMVVVRASSAETVMGEPVACDECWLESEGLPPDVAGLRRGLAGLTLDRLVMLQLDAIRRAPRSPEPGLPFLARPASTREERRSLDTPSDVAARIEARVAAAGRTPGAAVDAVRRHELVHVYDAARLLPFTSHPFAALAFAFSHGFDGAATERGLEARAQALSIGAAREPRLALAALLAFLPVREGETPHAAAYRAAAQAAVDLILEDPASFPSIDLARNVVQQMDVLTDAEVRELSRRLATKL